MTRLLYILIFSILLFSRSVSGEAEVQYAIKPQFEDARPFSEGLASVKIEGRWGYIDKTGEYVIRPQFDDVKLSFEDGLALVAIGRGEGKWGYINKVGEYVINPQFDDAWPFSEGLALVAIGRGEGKWGYINKVGEYVINPQFDDAWPFSEGLARVASVIGGGISISQENMLSICNLTMPSLLRMAWLV